MTKLEDVESFPFPGGELQVTLTKENDKHVDGNLYATIRTAEDVMKLLLVTDAYKRKYGYTPALYLPYIPYARQDRAANAGEALSIKVFADLINLQNYPKVHVLDPHSDVSSVLINNIHITDSTVFAKRVWDSLPDEYTDEAIIVAPDAGALKKTHKVAKAVGYDKEVIFCEKIRNTKTGEITGTKVYTEDFQDKIFVLFDDICDGGKTFIEIAKVLKAKGAKKVILVVSHGIFSKGLDVMFEFIDEIFCTDSFRTIEHPNDREKNVSRYFKQYSALEIMQNYDKEDMKKYLRKAI